MLGWVTSGNRQRAEFEQFNDMAIFFIDCFLISFLFRCHRPLPLDINSIIGTNKFERIMILITLFLPVILSAFAAFSIVYMSVHVEKMAWVLYVSAFQCGSFMAVEYLKRKNDMN